jgi:hypothetical protein
MRFEPAAAIGRLDVVGCDYYHISQRGRLCEEAGTSEQQISPLRDAPRRSGRNDGGGAMLRVAPVEMTP